VILGLLPAIGSGIGEMVAAGQGPRLLDGYLGAYARAFDGVRYFSYLPETLDRYTTDPHLLSHVRVLAPARRMPRARRAVTMAITHGNEIRGCAVLRVFQVTGVIPALIARARFGVPYVTTYGFSYDQLSRPGPKRVVKAAVERLGLRRAAAVIATTEPLRDRAARYARRVSVIPNGVDTAAFAPAAKPAAGAETARILYVGRLSAEKNLETVVRALGTLRGRVAARLVLAGAGPEEPHLRAAARAASVDTEFLGIVDQRALPALYASADAFVLASFTEGHPKALLEAMSAGAPCVVSDCEGIRTIVDDGDSALVVDPHRPDDLAAALERVLSDRVLAASLGKRARDVVVERYDLGRLMEREIALLRDVGAARGLVA
jgi:glycosyltransferase involved in cell wall biosynthesis